MKHEKLSRTVDRTVLDSGARVLSSFMPGASAAFGFGFTFGSIFDPSGLEELFHLIEHLLLKGAPGLPHKIASRILEQCGKYTAHTLRFQILVPCLVTIRGRQARKDFKRAFRTLSKLVAQPTFDEQEFLLEREAVIREMESRISEPAWRAYDLLYGTLFGKENSLARETTIDPHAIELLTREKVLSHCRGLFDPRYLVVLSHGGLSHQSLIRAAEAFFRRSGEFFKKHQATNFISTWHETVTQKIENFTVPDPLILRPEPLISDRLPPELGGIAVGCRVPSFKNPDRYALEVLKCIVGGHPIPGEFFYSGDLFNKLREERGLMYHPEEIEHEASPWSGCFYVLLQTNRHLIEKVEEVTVSLFKSYRRDGISRSKVEDAKKKLITHFRLMRSDDKFSFLRWMLDAEIGGMPKEIHDYTTHIRKVTRRSIMDVIERFFDPDTQLVRALVYPA